MKNGHSPQQQRDPDFTNALIALRRAAKRARERARRARNTVVVYRNGKIVEEQLSERDTDV